MTNSKDTLNYSEIWERLSPEARHVANLVATAVQANARLLQSFSDEVRDDQQRDRIQVDGGLKELKDMNLLIVKTYGQLLQDSLESLPEPRACARKIWEDLTSVERQEIKATGWTDQERLYFEAEGQLCGTGPWAEMQLDEQELEQESYSLKDGLLNYVRGLCRSES